MVAVCTVYLFRKKKGKKKPGREIACSTLFKFKFEFKLGMSEFTAGSGPVGPRADP